MAVGIAAGILALSSESFAAAVIFNVNMTGQKEVTAGGIPNQGDLDGFAIGTISLDSGTGGNTGIITWNLDLGGLPTPPVTDFHIHTGAATTAGGVFIGMGVNTGAGDTLSATEFNGTRTGLSSANINTVLANPAGFYFNIHNGQFPSGAVRDQVPEPSTIGLLALAALAALGRRKR